MSTLSAGTLSLKGSVTDTIIGFDASGRPALVPLSSPPHTEPMRDYHPAPTLPALAVLAAACMLSSAPAAAQGLGPERGRALAQQFCARCHAISAAQERPGEADAPSFRRIAANPRWTRPALIDMMTVPHLNMPPPVLTPAEAEEVVTYIQSLR